jgi:hypothetical protein
VGKREGVQGGKKGRLRVGEGEMVKVYGWEKGGFRVGKKEEGLKVGKRREG